MSQKNEPWIREREATVCLWKPDQTRGYISNMTASLLTDFLCFSRRQLEEYVKMIRLCGFTGIQVTDICSAWRACGSWERVHDQFKDLADILHREGMSFTLWVWAAEFSDYGWHDDDVVYSAADPDTAPCDDPRVVAAFDKYYDIYADMAPYADRLIAHFFDPGHLTDTRSVLFFARRLFERFRRVNPSVRLGIDTWAAADDFPDQLVEAGFTDVMLMELPFLPTWGVGDKRARYRSRVKALGCELGSWGWYTCEYETDQGPFMSVNDRVIADVYRKTREQGDRIMVPSYWSEMDAYHVVNFFSLYVAGHLLIDPESDTDALLADAARLVAGEKGTRDLLFILELIRDARSGDSFSAFWWNEPQYVLLCADHADILTRSDEAIARLTALIDGADGANDAHLPIPVRSLYRLMLPQLHQIRQYADFSVQLAAAKRAKEAGETKAQLQARVDALPFSVPEYNNIIGLWGLPETRAAYRCMEEFCRENGLAMPDDPALRYVQKRRIYDHACVYQRGKKEPLWLWPLFYEGGAAFGAERTRELVEELCREGVFMHRAEDDFVALKNWQSFAFDFQI